MKKHIIGIAAFIVFTAGALMAGASEKPEPTFKLLPFGSVRPAGWIKAQLNGDASGGALAYYHRNWQVQNKAYELRGNNPDKKNKQSFFWDGAAEGYWGLALISSAILADDPALKKRADEFVAAILKSQDADGYIGIHGVKTRYSPELIDKTGHIGFMLQGLLNYAQAYGRKDVLDAVERAVQCDMKNFNRSTPKLCASWAMVMSYPQFLDLLAQATGKKEYSDYAAFLVESYSGAAESPVCFGDARLKNLLDINKPFVGHACNTTGNLSLPWINYYATGNPQYKQAGENAFVKFGRQMSLSGSLPGDEDNYGRLPNPDIGIEFCSTTYLVENALIVAGLTGQSRFFDMAERCLFNAGMGARLPDGSAHAYLKRDTEFCLEYPLSELDGYSGRYLYSPTHEPFCCTCRMMSVMPVYIANMFKKTADDKALAAVCFGPASVETEMNGVKVQIEEKTMYPFDGKIAFSINPEKPVAFDFMVRVPTWATKADIKCDGAQVERQGEYCIVKKEWKAGDVVSVAFDTPVEAIPWVNGEYALKSGPLVFAVKLDAVPVKHTDIPSTHSTQKTADGKLTDYGFTPGPHATEKWNGSFSALLKDQAFGFKRAGVQTKNPDQPWAESPLQLKGPMIRGRKIHNNAVLVPMGCTVLRRVTLPWGYSDEGNESGKRGASTMVDQNTSE